MVLGSMKNTFLCQIVLFALDCTNTYSTMVKSKIDWFTHNNSFLIIHFILFINSGKKCFEIIYMINEFSQLKFMFNSLIMKLNSVVWNISNITSFLDI